MEVQSRRLDDRTSTTASEQQPRISVAVTTCRRAHYLECCLRSVLAQTVLPAEIVVSEDGEDPETAEVIARLSHEGVPIRHHRNVPPLKQAGNRRRAIELTVGDFVAMLDDDDEWRPEFLAKTSAALVEHVDCGFAMTDHWLIDEQGEVLLGESAKAARRFGRDRLATGTYDDVLLRHLTSKTMTLVTALFRRAVLEEVDFIPGRPVWGGDFALFVELGARRVRVHYLAERLGGYRLHPQQTIASNRVVFGSSILGSLRRVSSLYELLPAERRQLGTLFRSTTVELAIAYAHQGERRAALRTLRSYRELGGGIPSLWRVTVLVALLLGIRPLRRGPPIVPSPRSRNPLAPDPMSVDRPARLKHRRARRAGTDGESTGCPGALPTPSPDWPESWQLSYRYDLLEIVGGYDTVYEAKYRSRRDLTLDLVRRVAPPGARVLEVGAGQGNFTLRLAELGYRVTWNDLRADLVGYVRAKHRSGDVQYLPGDVFTVAPPDRFDVVLAAEIIEHVAHPDAFLARLREFLRPGGHVILTTPNGAYFRNRLPRFTEFANPAIYESVQFRPDASGHIFLLHPREIATLARSAGFEPVLVKAFQNPLSAGWVGTAQLARVLPRPVVSSLEMVTRRMAPKSLQTHLAAVLRRAL